MNLYELTSEVKYLYELMDDPEVSPEAIVDTMESVQLDYADKADAYGKVLRMRELDVEALKAEEARLASHRKAIEANIERVKEAMRKSLEALDIKTYKSNMFTFTRRASSSVEIDDINKVPAEYVEVEMTLKPDKKRIKEFLSKQEVQPEWAHIKHSESLTIK